MNLFQALAYFANEALRNLVRGWRISSLAVATTALSLFIGGMLILAGSNMTRAVENWRSEAQVVAYLEMDLSPDEITKLADELRATPGVEALVEVGPDRARERFRDRFPDLGEVVSDFEQSPFPTSLEMRVRMDRSEVGGWLEDLRGRPEVSELDNDADWLSTMTAAASVARALGVLVGGILIVAAAVSIASVVRLSTFVYRKEIATMRLIGATEFFVRGPFVVEGLVQGLTGSCLALAALGMGYWSLARLELPWFVRDSLLGSFLSPAQALVLLAVGGLAGLIGGIIPLRERSGVFG